MQGDFIQVISRHHIYSRPSGGRDGAKRAIISSKIGFLQSPSFLNSLKNDYILFYSRRCIGSIQIIIISLNDSINRV
jgi:hypothetical protein